MLGLNLFGSYVAKPDFHLAKACAKVFRVRFRQVKIKFRRLPVKRLNRKHQFVSGVFGAGDMDLSAVVHARVRGYGYMAGVSYAKAWEGFSIKARTSQM